MDEEAKPKSNVSYLMLAHLPANPKISLSISDIMTSFPISIVLTPFATDTEIISVTIYENAKF